MKTLVAAAFALVSVNVLADDRLLEITMHSGFVPPQYAYSVECKLSDSYVESRTFSGAKGDTDFNVVATIYTASVPNAAVARRLIAAAAKGKMITSVGPTDGPTETYKGVIGGEVVTSVVNLSSNGTTIKKNSAKGVDALIEFGNTNCHAPSFPL